MSLPKQSTVRWIAGANGTQVNATIRDLESHGFQLLQVVSRPVGPGENGATSGPDGFLLVFQRV